jgi:hypothetical protein
MKLEAPLLFAKYAAQLPALFGGNLLGVRFLIFRERS